MLLLLYCEKWQGTLDREHRHQTWSLPKDILCVVSAGINQPGENNGLVSAGFSGEWDN